ncbi:helicase [Staphylococcus sp. EG-SA-13]|nr:helicase [Staphylococcus sp. EG-SA-13]
MEEILLDNLESREKIIKNLKEEFIGPIINFDHVQIIDEKTTKENLSSNLLAYKHAGITEEIFTDGKPSKKYAAGLLYPNLYNTVQIDEDIEELELDDRENNTNESTKKEDIVSNMYRQSTMGLTFAVDKNIDEINVNFECGIYEEKKDYNKELQINSSTNKWWMRKSQESNIKINLKRSEKTKSDFLNLFDKSGKKNNYHKVKLYSNIREINEKLNIVTITIDNVTEKNDEEGILFQCGLNVTLSHQEYFSPYPNLSELNVDISEEEKKFELLYLTEKNYSFGHDCSTIWDSDEDDNVYRIKTTFIPEYETKTMTPDITVEGKSLEMHHAKIAGAKSPDELIKLLEPLVFNYEKWFNDKKKYSVDNYYKEVKSKNLKEIENSLNRMKKGLELLEDIEIFNCFKLTNLAMLMQMNNGKDYRNISFVNNKIEFDKELNINRFDMLDYRNLDFLSDSIMNEYKNNNKIYVKSKWRGFQIAFILQSLDGLVHKKVEDREIVDLIWFPTGGGKTEAYLGVAAFSMLYRRFKDNSDTGVDIIMRYTLRLLTADQFQRSARLVCSCEFIRSHMSHLLGEDEFSIGLWVGETTTPNSFEKAKKTYLDAKNKNKAGFIIENCPWCGAELKVLKTKGKNTLYAGYNINHTLITHCPDQTCHFHKKLPIEFVDELIYKNPPTFLIGTIDKFVQLAWKPESRFLFGIDKQGNRYKSPPNLIIQDELHLISGPLGSLTGMFEILVENLCTDRRDGNVFKPKIIGATATIKSYEEQIKALFAREKTQLFPPSGLNINDNFFSVIKYDDDVEAPGRKYIGIYTTTQGKLQSQVQAFSSIISTSTQLKSNSKDPFWTILSFYNTIRDIGKAKTLTEQDIPNTLKNYYRKRNINNGRYIHHNKVKELTSRMNNNEITRSLLELKNSYNYNKNEAIDICLASNIIEVGVDIDRLALMTIIGQPKSTSQYIQVSGRVGRSPDKAPGLVLTIYNSGDSNDKSHFEHFIEYHQKLYAKVEESSVTPFSNFSINRGFPAVLIGFIRQNFDFNLGKLPDANKIREIKDDVINFLKNEVKYKMDLIDNKESQKLMEITQEILNSLANEDYESWDSDYNKHGAITKLYENRDESKKQKIEVISSMRNVDSTSKLEPLMIGSFDEFNISGIFDEVRK